MTEPVNELRELLETVGISITWLFNLSMILRDPTPVDRYAKAASLGIYDTQPDIDYVRNKMPYLLRSGDEWLIERLGEANTLRRKFFKYCEKHRQKLAYIGPPPPSDDASEFGPAPSALTTASAYVERFEPTQGVLEDQSFTSFENQSITSYTTSMTNERDNELRVPPQPKESLAGKPFECPYCYTIQVVKGERSWRYYICPWRVAKADSDILERMLCETCDRISVLSEIVL